MSEEKKQEHKCTAADLEKVLDLALKNDNGGGLEILATVNRIFVGAESQLAEGKSGPSAT